MSSEVKDSGGFYEFLAWLELNKKRLAVAAVAIAIVALIISFVVWRKNARESEANEALLKLGLPLQSSENSPPPSATDLLKLANDYSHTSAGARALLMAATTLFDENKFTEASELFKKYETQYGSSRVVPIAALGAAACLEAQNKTTEALAAYQRIASTHPNEPVAAQARLAMGRLYETKKPPEPEQALRSYDEILRQTTRSPWQAEAQERREQLLIRYPQLAPTNPPIASLNKLLGTNQINTNAGLAPKANAPQLSTTNSASPNAATNKPPLAKPTETGR